ncbi:two-component system, OmpR family, osmolarity sensor histidine kinase EnvZ [Roseateles sp. YR242]|uniref:ATP-binding protein n=1 Tax=Roseateles sp. YR242 TaxID=1855305 RepID=UPI0008B36AD3|nr:ATP-binding protein [Roseateles sp. YR242]SEL58260.1 two-component system, OmpR family, osmolarity sensor histidine kinase EnvZ [Roseateles sp. YR242]
MSLWPASWRQASLFQRLLLVQLSLALGLAVVVGLLFYVERNVTVATLFADLWAPRMAAAAGLEGPPADPPSDGTLLVLVRAQPPESARRTSLFAPRFVALRQVLRGHGVPATDIRLELGRHEPRIWLQVERPGTTSVWLGVSGRMVAPEWSRRALLALVLCMALVVGLSWWTARRLAQPLEQLRQRLQAQKPGAMTAPAPAPLLHAWPEVSAIDAAYSELLARWQQHERERALLLAGVSHDLRSPLGRIRMAAELLPQEPAIEKRKAAVVRNVGEADRLIESFLDFVRSGELPCEDVVDLADAARRVVNDLDRPAEQLQLEAPDQLLMPKANRLLVERLITNLVENALKHGRPPVRVTLTGATHESMRMEVEDAGDGLDPHQLEALQEAFRRGDSARTQAGSGLGLAIVRQVVERLGGVLSFEREASRQRVVVTWPPARTR